MLENYLKQFKLKCKTKLANLITHEIHLLQLFIIDQFCDFVKESHNKLNYLFEVNPHLLIIVIELSL